MKKGIVVLLSILFATQISAQLKFKPERKEIHLGDSVKLNWEVKGIKKVTNIRIKNTADSLATQGSIYVKPDKSKSYRLEVFTKKKNKYYKKGTYIKVFSPEINIFKTSTENNNDRDSTEIYWRTEYAQYVQIEGFYDSLPANGKIKILLDTTSTIHLKAFNRNGVFAQSELYIPIKNIEYLTGTSAVFLYDTATIRWQFKYSKYVKLNSQPKKFKPTDKLRFVLKKDTTLHFLVFRENGDTLKKSYSVHIKSPIYKFNIPYYIYKGMTPTMTWDVDKRFKVQIRGNGKTIRENSGFIKLPVDTLKSYTITVKDHLGRLIEKRTKGLKKVKSPIIEFDIPKQAFVNVPTIIYWEVPPSYQVSILGLERNLIHKGSRIIVPVADKKYIIIVSYKGQEIERKTILMKVKRRRAFVNNVIDVKDIDKDSELNFEIFAIDERNYPKEVKLYLLAVDDNGNFVKGLEKKNKTAKKKIIRAVIEKSGRSSRKISNYSFKEYSNTVSLPYDISMALDYSGSMYGNIDSLEKAVHEFIEQKDQTDQIAIARFDHRIAQVTALENNKDSLLSIYTMNGLDTLGGGTALYAGSDFAMQMMDSSNNNKILIIFTDGMENSSMGFIGQYAYSATQLAQKAKQKKVTIHVIAYGNGVNNGVLKKLAYTTGGNFYKLNSYQDINRVFEELPIIFKNYYVIRYKPAQKKGEHSVRIVYNNLQGRYYSTESKYQVGTKFTISEHDNTYPDTYWMKAADSLGMAPVSVPQAIAYFDFDKDILLDQYKKSIDVYVDYLNNQENTTAIIFGHTDSKGTDEYCYDLSLRRAQKVKDYMVKQGIDENRIFIKGCGKDEMLWKPEDKEWKAHENRRTEILLLD